MNRKDIIDILNYCEKEFNTKTWEIDGDKVWPLIRFEMGYMLYWHKDSLEFKRNYYGLIFKAFKNLFSGGKFIFSKGLNKELFEKSDFLFFNDGSGYSKIGNFWYDKHCDTIIDEFDESFSFKSIKIDYNYNTFTPKYRWSFQIRLILDFINLKSLIFPKRCRNIELKGFENFVTFCNNKNFHFSLSDRKKLEKRYLMWKSTEDYFLNKILLNKKLKCCFTLTYYGFHSSALVSACKTLNIPVVDLQHGLQGDSHFAYSSWSNMPLSGYKLLPDYFWCWTKKDADVINFWSIKSILKKNIAFNGGNVFFDSFLKMDNVVFTNHINSIKSRLDVSKKTILYTCTLYSIESKLNPIIEVINKTQDKFNWLIRIHPQERDEIKKFIKYFNSFNVNNYHIDWCTSDSLFSILSCIDLHITFHSSVIIEAEEFGVKSIILDKQSTNIYLGQIERKSCKYLMSYELIDYLNKGDFCVFKNRKFINSESIYKNHFFDLINIGV
jgi:hypothetical protein